MQVGLVRSTRARASASSQKQTLAKDQLRPALPGGFSTSSRIATVQLCQPGRNGRAQRGFSKVIKTQGPTMSLGDFHLRRNKTALCAQSSATSSPSTPPVLDSPAVWYGRDLRSCPEVWTHVLTATEVQEIQAAVKATEHLDIIDIKRDNFPLPTFGPTLRSIYEELREGRGFKVLRGFPVDTWSARDAAAAYYGMGTWLGDAVSQNAKGHVLGHVKDIGGDPADPATRIYTTALAQPFHTDSCDIVGLLCLHKAMEGGHSTIVSSTTVYNEVVRQRPELAECLLEDFHLDRKGEVPPGMDPWFRMPLFIPHAGRLTSWYDRSFIAAAQQRFPELPRLSALQQEALDLADQVCNSEDVRLDMTLEPGDVQLLHNHQIWHARSAYKDAPDAEGNRRHLLRLWLSTPDGWELPEQFSHRYGVIELGKVRGGIQVEGTRLNAPLEAS